VDIDVPPLVPGQGKSLLVPVPLPVGLRVAFASGVPEYSTVNNIAKRTVFVSTTARTAGGLGTP